jgi:hypothetical protein
VASGFYPKHPRKRDTCNADHWPMPLAVVIPARFPNGAAPSELLLRLMNILHSPAPLSPADDLRRPRPFSVPCRIAPLRRRSVALLDCNPCVPNAVNIFYVIDFSCRGGRFRHVCSWSFHPIRCDFVAAFSGRTALAAAMVCFRSAHPWMRGALARARARAEPGASRAIAACQKTTAARRAIARQKEAVTEVQPPSGR